MFVYRNQAVKAENIGIADDKVCVKKPNDGVKGREYGQRERERKRVLSMLSMHRKISMAYKTNDSERQKFRDSISMRNDSEMPSYLCISCVVYV